MTETLEKKEERLFKDEDIYEMFNTSFLPTLQKFAKHAQKHKWKEKDIAYLKVELILLFENQDDPLTYQMLKEEEKILLQMTPIEKQKIPKAEIKSDES